MTVTSIASGSFQAQVWGITYTVNWSGQLPPEFFLRKGNKDNATTSVTEQLQVGDEVGVSGSVSATSPMVVAASVVRDYSITAPRPGLRRGQSDSPYYNGVGNGGGNGNGQGEDNQGVQGSTSTSSTSTSANLQLHLNDLMTQFHNLQNLLKQNGNGNGNGNGKGGNDQ
jgi:hypothetical protein